MFLHRKPKIILLPNTQGSLASMNLRSPKMPPVSKTEVKLRFLFEILFGFLNNYLF